MKIQKGAIVRFIGDVTVVRNTCQQPQNRAYRAVGWNSATMPSVVRRLQGIDLEVTGTDYGEMFGDTLKFDGDANALWPLSCFTVVKTALDVQNDKERELTGYKLHKAGDSVVRKCRFTDSFVEGEVHVVDRISTCGMYLWVHGHRHKVPQRYFAKAESSEPTVPELTDFSESKCGLTSGSDPTEPKPFDVGDKVRSNIVPERTYTVDSVRWDRSYKCWMFRKAESIGQGFVSCISYTKLEPAKPMDPTPEGDDLAAVVKAVTENKPLEYYYMGEWVRIDPTRITLGQLVRLPVRVAPEPIDFYGVKLPKPLDVATYQKTPVYGVSFNNKKTFPCSLSTARVNLSKGYGMYFKTLEDANLVLKTLTKPFEV